MESAEMGPEDPRVRLAGERTALAWIRTGLAMMGLGFVVARFGLFLQELGAVNQAPRQHSSSWSLGLGIVLILLGVLVNLVAAVQHQRFLARVSRGEAYEPPRWSLAVVVAVILALLGVGMAVYLLMFQ